MPHRNVMQAPRGKGEAEALVLQQQIDDANAMIDALRATNAMPPEMGNLTVKNVFDSMAEEDWGEDFKPGQIVCDGDGCVVVPINIPGEKAEVKKAEPLELDLYSKGGRTWMLGIDRNPRKAGYAAKIGGNGWDLTLTREEYGEFISLFQKLRFSVASLGYKGQWYGKSDKPKLEMKSSIVRIQAFPAADPRDEQKKAAAADADGDKLPDVPFAIRFVFSSPGDRVVSGVWGANAVLDALKTLDNDDILNFTAEEEEYPLSDGAGYAI